MSATAFTGAFDRARAAAPDEVFESRLIVAGRPVLVRGVGDGLRELFARAFVPGGDARELPALVLDLWEEASSGVGDPAAGEPNRVLERHGPAGERFAPSPDGRSVRYCGVGFDIRLDLDGRHAVGWVADARGLSSWHRARPLQTLFMPWLADLGMVAVHAGMVSRAGRGALVAGPSHVGKSTTVAACALAAFGALGDDAIALERTAEGGLTGHCLHAAIKLRDAGLDRLPAAAALVHPASGVWEGESVLFLPEALPQRMTASATVAAVLLPRLSGEAASAVEPLGRGAALRELTGCGLSFEPGRLRDDFELVAELAARTPCLRLHVGTDASRVPEAVAEALGSAAVAGDMTV